MPTNLCDVDNKTSDVLYVVTFVFILWVLSPLFGDISHVVRFLVLIYMHRVDRIPPSNLIFGSG